MSLVDTETGEIVSLEPEAPSLPGIVAFHELVAVKSWADSSSRGATIKVAIPSRDSLAIFETITRRSGKRAGQRYKAVFQSIDGAIKVPMDLWFAGANWAHQDGASVKFSLETSDLEFFRDGTLVMEVDGDPVYYWLTLVQIDSDEKPIDQKKAEVMEELKGGPRSKRVAMLCQQADFHRYVEYRGHALGENPDVSADTWVKLQCGISSKREFDHNEDAWNLFQTRVMSPFIRWGQNERGAWEDEEADEGGS